MKRINLTHLYKGYYSFNFISLRKIKKMESIFSIQKMSINLFSYPTYLMVVSSIPKVRNRVWGVRKLKWSKNPFSSARTDDWNSLPSKIENRICAKILFEDYLVECSLRIYMHICVNYVHSIVIPKILGDIEM